MPGADGQRRDGRAAARSARRAGRRRPARCAATRGSCRAARRLRRGTSGPAGSPPGSWRPPARRAAGRRPRRRRRGRRRTGGSGRAPRGAGRLVVAGHAVVEQHVLRRLEPGDPEVAQPPQVQPAARPSGGRRGRGRPRRSRPAGPEREVGDLPVAARADRHRDAAHPGGERPTPRARRSACRARPRLGRVRPGQVEVDDGLVPRGPAATWTASDSRGRPARRAGELGHGAERGHEVRGPLVEGVVGDDERAAGPRSARAGRAARARGSGDG